MRLIVHRGNIRAYYVKSPRGQKEEFHCTLVLETPYGKQVGHLKILGLTLKEAEQLVGAKEVTIK